MPTPFGTQDAFTSFDVYTWLMLVLVALGGALAMRSIASLVNATLGALVVFACAVFARGILGARDMRLAASTDWDTLLDLKFRFFVVYTAILAAAIGLTYGLRLLLRE